DGPYVVDGDIPMKEVITEGDQEGATLDYKEGQSFAQTQTAKYICRCGHSAKKPFCDGKHNAIDFDGAETDNRKTFQEEAEIEEGAVHDALVNEKLCSTARFCDRGAGFWAALINGDIKEQREYAEEVGSKCPSGRFTLVNKDGRPIEPELPKEIYLVKDEPIKRLGPLYLRGGIQIIGADDFKYDLRNRATLCRCGASQNKPFCDGAHTKCEHMEIKE
ncbi:MAG: CDGSH iron-sulfur domain-containing protein, partial [Firmicutes bacterium]|nr:CDGSH iron-sulfur domain-containing protein [Bacillota bacterium]